MIRLNEINKNIAQRAGLTFRLLLSHYFVAEDGKTTHIPSINAFIINCLDLLVMVLIVYHVLQSQEKQALRQFYDTFRQRDV